MAIPITESGPTAHFSYDRDENVVYVSFPPETNLLTREEISGHFDRVLSFFQRHLPPTKSYCVVNYDNFYVNVAENVFYGEQMARVLPLLITVVRYGGSTLQRTNARIYNLKLHADSHLYDTKDEALRVVRELKAGALHLAPRPSPKR
jgi:hypothetical protein